MRGGHQRVQRFMNTPTRLMGERWANMGAIIKQARVRNLGMESYADENSKMSIINTV